MQSVHLFALSDGKKHFLKSKKSIRRLVRFQNMLSQKSCILKYKKLSLWMKAGLRSFCKHKALLVNIIVGNVRNDPNYPHLINHKIHWKLKKQTQKIIATICRNLHCQSHSQQLDLNLLTWLRLSIEEEFWCINLTSIPIWFWGYEEREVLKIFGEIKKNYLRWIFPIWNKLL